MNSSVRFEKDYLVDIVGESGSSAVFVDKCRVSIACQNAA